METVLKASEGLTTERTDIVADPRLSSIAALEKILKIWDSSVTEYYMLRHPRIQDGFSEMLRGAILVAGLNPAQVRADAQWALHELENSEKSHWDLIEDARKSDIEPDPDWSIAQDGGLRSDLLLQAMRHPSSLVVRFSALLLLNCVEENVVALGLQDLLASGSGYVLDIIAQVAADVWRDEAANLILNRLEQNFTDDCAPLIRALGDICDESARNRVQAILREAFESGNVDIVEAALETTRKLGLDEALATTIENRYRWWLTEGPQYPGVVPKNAASALLAYLVANKRMSFDEIREAANAKRSDVRQVAIRRISQFLAKEDDLVEPVLRDIDRGELPVGIIGELSKSHPTVCKRHLKRFLGLLNSDNRPVRIACIRALGAAWADSSEVEKALRSLLNVPDTDIRDEAVKALRRLREHSRVKIYS